ncbi:Eukaryotic translation initiation factor 4 gamma 2 [Chamberlinius hualienensis]
MPDAIAFLTAKTLGKSDSDRETVCKLFANMKQESMLNSSQFMEGFKRVLLQMADLEVDVPRVKSYVALFAAHAVITELATLAELAEPLENGAHYPLFPLCLQQLHKLQGKQWLSCIFNESKVNLQNMLPEIDRTKERLMDVLEDRGLSFLFPLLRIQADLWRQMQIDPNPGVFYKWVKENVAVNQQTQPGFINALISCLLKYITQKTTLADGVDTSVAPDKILQEKEKELLGKYKPVFQAFLNDHVDLQVIALYTLQVHCYNNNFPKGMLLRWFMLLYSDEIIEEEAFLQWKEDISDQYPGKGKALFQVNQWLTWLEEAEEEEDGSDEGDN